MYNVTDSVKMLAVSRKKERTMGGTVLFHVSYNRGGHPKFLVICCPQFVWNMNLTEIALLFSYNNGPLLSLQIQKEKYSFLEHECSS